MGEKKKAKKAAKKAAKAEKKAAKKAAKAKPRAIPKGREGVTPYLIVKGAAGAMDFYKKAFGATEHERIPGPEGKVMHAEMKVGKALFMLADEFPEMGFKSPKAHGGTSVSLYIYVEDVDALYEQATAAGAIGKRPPETQFYGDRSCGLEDPFGHSWGFATHVEDVSKEELAKRAADPANQKSGSASDSGSTTAKDSGSTTAKGSGSTTAKGSGSTTGSSAAKS